MTTVQHIIIFSTSIIILLFVDACRRKNRKKYKNNIAHIQFIQSQEKVEENCVPKINFTIPTLNTEFEKNQTTYPKLKKGIISYFINSPHGYIFNGGDLNSFFNSQGLSFNKNKQRFEFLTQDKDVLFSIHADNPNINFSSKNFLQGSYTCLEIICDLTKLSQFYDIMACFKHLTNHVYKINAHLGGSLLNESKQFFTIYDEKSYIKHLKKFSLLQQSYKN